MSMIFKQWTWNPTWNCSLSP